jgi:hypothetical protein
VQLSENRLCEPSGVGPSGMREAPAPMSSPPQPRFLMTALEPSFVLPQLPAEAVRTKSRMVGGGWVVLVVVDVEVVVDDVLVVDVEVVDVVVDEVVVGGIVEVVVDVVLVVTVVEVVVGTVVVVGEGLVVVVLDVVVDGGMVVVVGDVVDVVVEDASGHSEKSILQSPVQSRAPLGDGHVKPPKALPSHSSPASSTPLPQSSVVVVVVVVDVDVVVEELPVVVVVGGNVELVVVVVTGTSGAHLTVTFRLPARVRAHAAPVNVAPRPMPSFALGAVMNARTSSCAPK